MDNGFRCLDCGAEFVDPAADQTDCRCSLCAAKLAERACVAKVGERSEMGKGVVFSLVLVLMVIVAGVFFVGQGTDDDGGGPADGKSQTQAIDKILTKALGINAKTPLMIDPSTRLDQVVVQDQTITYKTTLVNFTAEIAKDDLAKRDLFKNEIGPFLSSKYCNDKNTRKALELGIRYGHEYFGTDGALLYTATVSADDC